MKSTDLEILKDAGIILAFESGNGCYSGEEAEVFITASDFLERAIRRIKMKGEDAIEASIKNCGSFQ